MVYIKVIMGDIWVACVGHWKLVTVGGASWVGESNWEVWKENENGILKEMVWWWVTLDNHVYESICPFHQITMDNSVSTSTIRSNSKQTKPNFLLFILLSYKFQYFTCNYIAVPTVMTWVGKFRERARVAFM